MAQASTGSSISATRIGREVDIAHHMEGDDSAVMTAAADTSLSASFASP